MWILTVLPCGKHCQTIRLGLSQDSNYAGDFEDSKSTSGETLCILEVIRLFQPARMCNTQTSVSHSSTESEIISLDAGLRLDRMPVLDLWDLIVAVLGNTNQSNKARGDLCTNQREVRSTPHTIQKRKHSHGTINDLDIVDLIPSNVNSSRQEALLYVFEDNEAVIKMIIKGKKPDNETCFQNPQSYSWLVVWSNQFGPQDPNQLHWHQKPTRRHTDKGKFHTWWMESSFVFVQHQPFQFHQLFWSDVEKNAKTKVKKELQQNRSRWWIWSCDAAKGILTCLPLLHQKARGKPR